MNNNKVTMMYDTDHGVEIGFDLANASNIDFHLYDFANIDYDARILCGGISGTSASSGGHMNIVAFNLNWNGNALTSQEYVFEFCLNIRWNLYRTFNMQWFNIKQCCI